MVADFLTLLCVTVTCRSEPISFGELVCKVFNGVKREADAICMSLSLSATPVFISVGHFSAE